MGNIMKFVVLNGSPKGNKLSFTMQYIYYAQKMFPYVEFSLINIGQKLNNMKIKEELDKHRTKIK